MTTRGNHPTDRGHDGPGRSLSHIDEWTEQAIDYLEGRATPEQKAAIEAHLAVCPDCAGRMAEQQDTAALMQSLVLDDAPAHLRQAVIEAVLPSLEADARQSPSKAATGPRSIRSRLDLKFRHWIPVTAVVIVALVASMATYGALRQNMQPSHVDQGGDPRVEVQTLVREDAPAAADSSPVIEDAVSAEGSTAATVNKDGDDDTSSTTATVSPASLAQTEIREKTAMKAALQDAETALVFTFEAPDALGAAVADPDETSDSPISTDEVPRSLAAAVAEDVVAHITAVIDLQRLPVDPSADGPSFAALVSRDELTAFWQLLVAIEAAHDVSLALCPDPDPDQAPGLALTNSDRAGLPIVHSQPSAASGGDKQFITTSSSGPSQTAPGITALPTVDDTHVLIIINIRQM